LADKCFDGNIRYNSPRAYLQTTDERSGKKLKNKTRLKAGFILSIVHSL